MPHIVKTPIHRDRPDILTDRESERESIIIIPLGGRGLTKWCQKWDWIDFQHHSTRPLPITIL